MESQQLSKDTLNILAIINYKYWVKNEEHKKWLLSQYKKNGKLHKNIEVKELFNDERYDNKDSNNNEIVVIKKESFFKRMLNFIRNSLK